MSLLFILVFMLVPVLITRSIMVLSSKGKKELVSTSFIARFSNGSEKVLNKTGWQQIGLIRQSDLIDTPLSKDACALYSKDWSLNPILGSWDKHYPALLIPSDIAVLLPVNSLLN
jgi:hypothetical protein